MNFSRLAWTTKSIALQLPLALALGALGSGLQAQQVYRIVGPDGRVTFSDQPPASSSNTKVTTGVGSRAGTDANLASLSFELREVATKYPVTLYTGNSCGPCSSGRSLLAARGIPFTEKTVTTSEDADALQRLSGEVSLPFMTIGGQQIKGYSDVEWGQFLDAAGYPKTSTLPGSYRNPPASALVASKKVDAPAAGASAAQASSSTDSGPNVVSRRPGSNRAAGSGSPATQTDGSNPAGIKF
jgi:glutaredoxin